MSYTERKSYTAAETRYDQMLYQRCGNSGLKLPIMSLGLWHNFGEDKPYENSRDLVLKSFDHGITHFDLANNYGNPAGSAEETFGRILKNDLKQYRDEIVVTTKAGFDMWKGPYGEGGSKKYLVSSLDQSLKRLGMDYVDIFYHHVQDMNTPLEETMDALAGIVRSGKALYVGLSNYGPDRLREAITILEEKGIHCLVHQHHYSMLYRQEKALLPVLREKQVGAVAYCPLEQGLLTDKYLNGIPEDSRVASNSIFLNEDRLTDDYLARVRKLNEIAAGRSQSLAQMALAYAIMDDELTSVILGASRFSQIEENLGALKNMEFSEEEKKAIEEVLD